MANNTKEKKISQFSENIVSLSNIKKFYEID